MRIYRTAHSISVGQWLFYPELLIAQNTHNGNLLYCRRRDDSTWVLSGVNIPAKWMIDEFVKWFAVWITGGKP